MRRFRVSIAGLLAGIGLLGVSLAALARPSGLWANAYYSLALGTLIIAVLGAIYSRASKRAFWVGFSVCGWAYFLGIFGPEPIGRFEGNAVTTPILDILYPLTLPREGAVAAPSGNPGARLIPASRMGRALISGRIILTGAFRGGPPAPGDPPLRAWEIWTEPDRNIDGTGTLSSAAYRQIGHSIFALIFALIGAHAARRFREARDAEPAAG